jgi:hypothetical protein
LRNKKRREKQKEKKAAEASGSPADESWSADYVPTIFSHRAWLMQHQIIFFQSVEMAVCLVCINIYTVTVYESDHSWAQTDDFL